MESAETAGCREVMPAHAGLVHLVLSVQWIGRGRFALRGVPSNLPDAAITGIYGNHT